MRGNHNGKSSLTAEQYQGADLSYWRQWCQQLQAENSQLKQELSCLEKILETTQHNLEDICAKKLKQKTRQIRHLKKQNAQLELQVLRAEVKRLKKRNKQLSKSCHERDYLLTAVVQDRVMSSSQEKDNAANNTTNTIRSRTD